MTHDEAIESLINSCKAYSNAVDRLKEEVIFLTDTIEKYNLKEISQERRALLNRVAQAENEAATAAKEVNKIKAEYENKLETINGLLTLTEEKRTNLEKYIEAEAEKKLAALKREQIDKEKISERKLAQTIIENNRELQLQSEFYKKELRKLLMLSVLVVLITAIGVYIFSTK